MRRILVLLSAIAVLATACGSATETVEAAAPAAPATVEQVDDAVVEEETAEVLTTTTTAESTLLASGRERILANHTEGKPYVLWYWGAH